MIERDLHITMSYKIYSDGCYIKEFNTAGVGGFIKAGDETVVEFSMEVQEQQYKELHERYAVKQALEIALQMGIEGQKVSLYSDDMGLMSILSKSYENTHAYINQDNLIKELCELRGKFKDLDFNYIPREQNKRADKLSRYCINKKVFAKSQMIPGAFKHKNLISKNNFAEDEQKEFRKAKKDINQYLVAHFYWNRNEKMRQMDFYEASVEQSSSVNYKLVSENPFVIEAGWERVCLNLLSDKLKEMRSSTGQLGLVLEDEFLILDKILRGRKEPSGKSRKAIEYLSETLDSFDKVVVHKEDSVINKIMSDKKSQMILTSPSPKG